ncbi:MAG: bifunctional hydroxymethylpyrimidine kinase/phosphomethylpyrimidine kinase [Gammaproteobacteria bacterium]|nr:bifunctional hydroxymethylpyrimidine kinase/phosphomethylpyrimidine kinase [Gammaproteobacteria bacterium]
MSKQRPLIFGEVLFDVFEDGGAVLGGAPFNVAWHLHGFGANPLFVSRVGDDDLGRQVIDAMQKWGMDCSALQTDPVHATGQVKVELEQGQPTYTIEQDVAYDHIDVDLLIPQLINSPPSLTYHGSLITREHDSRAGLIYLRSRLDSPVFIDINLRAPWHSREQAEALVEDATWLKLNDEELEIFAGRTLNGLDEARQAAQDLMLLYGLNAIIVTLGHEGAFVLSDAGSYLTPPAPAEDLIDTVGAGDALSSVILFGLAKDWPLQLALQRAVEFASAICEQKGATSFDKDLYNRFLEKWKT